MHNTATLIKITDISTRLFESGVHPVPLNSTKKYAKIFVRIQQGVGLWVVFNIVSQWSVSRGNGQIKRVS